MVSSGYLKINLIEFLSLIGTMSNRFINDFSENGCVGHDGATTSLFIIGENNGTTILTRSSIFSMKKIV